MQHHHLLILGQMTVQFQHVSAKLYSTMGEVEEEIEEEMENGNAWFSYSEKGHMIEVRRREDH